jgi:hypothetical protein
MFRGFGRASEPAGLARRLGQQGDWRALWGMVLSQPLPLAVASLAHLNRRKWSPPSESDAALADVLAGIDAKEAARLGGRLFDRTAQVLPFRLGFANPVGFAVRHPVAALSVQGRDFHTQRIVTVDRTGVRNTLYEGPAQHWSLCAIDSETVIARREFDSGGYRGDTEVVEYTPGGETVLANGGALLDAIVQPTATGFVVGTKLAAFAFALADGEQVQLNLGEFGLRRADLFAVDATGTRIAFADDTRMVVTDSRLQPLYDIVAEHLQHGGINAITFTEDSIVTAGWDKGLYRWQIIGGRIRGLHPGWDSSPRRFFRLSPVAPWNLLVADGGNVNYHYDVTSLDPVTAPGFLVPSGSSEKDDDLAVPRAIGKFVSTAYGRLAVYEGGLATRTRDSVSDFYSTVVQDLEHPLNVLNKPVAALTGADAERLLPQAGAYPLDAGERALLESVVRACEWAPGANGH